MSTIARLSVKGVLLNSVYSLVLFLVLAMVTVNDAGAAPTRLYVSGNTPAVSITGAGTSNLPIGNNAELAAADGSYITTLKTTGYGAGDTTTNMREYYVTRRPAAPYYLLGTAYFNTGFSTTATVLPNTSGSFFITSTNTSNGDRFRLRLIDYDPVLNSTTVIGSSTSDPAVSTATTNAVTVTFNNNANYTLPAGHYLGVEIRYYPDSNTAGRRVGILHANSSKQSYIDLNLQFPVSASATVNGQISAPGTTTATNLNSPVTTNLDYNSSKTYTVTADSGYTINSLTVDGAAVPAAVGNTSWPVTFNALNRSHTISANFVGSTNTFTIQANTGGHITVDTCPTCDWIGPITTTYGLITGSYVFTATPYAGYSIGEVYLSGVAQGVPGGQVLPYNIPVTLPLVTSLTVDFVPYVDVTSSVSGLGGTISPSGTTSVPSGQSITFDITPDAGYRILSITDTTTGTDLGTTSPVTLTNVTSTHNVVVTFQATFTITSSAGPNGTISPIGAVLADSGSSRNFSIMPDPGYRVADVLVDGTSVGAVTSYTFTNINSTHEIQVSFVAAPTPATYCAIPPFITNPAPANVMLMLSVETPMAGPANPVVTDNGKTLSDLTVTASSTGLGAYDNTKTYTGYFEVNKCYTYSGSGATGLFTPSGAATNHQCGGTAWSGNMLNWSTALAVDAFRKAFTGGNRAVDTTTDTVLLAAFNNNEWGINPPVLANAELYMPLGATANQSRKIVRQNAGIGFALCAAGQTSCTVTPSGSGEARWPVAGANVEAVYSLRIKACSTVGGTESRCNSTTNKPEGTIQKYMDKMRFGLFAYAADNNRNRDGGILREKMKWVQPVIKPGMKYHDASNAVATCSNAAGCANPEKEVNSDGTFVDNPDGASTANTNSGLINYINKFGYTSGYKQIDPVSELYYQVVRYFRNQTPSGSNFCNGLTEPNDGFLFYCNATKTNARGWRDPTLYSCSKNFVVAVNDANPHSDKRIPGTSFIADNGNNSAAGDWCGASSPSGACDADFLDGGVQVPVEAWTNAIGDWEAITGKTLATFGYACEVNNAGACITPNGNVTKLGRIMQSGRGNSYLVAGLAYYAHMTNLRPSLSSNFCSGSGANCTSNAGCPSTETCVIRNNLTTFMIDTQEPQGSMTVGPKNMLQLAAKYGGFESKETTNTLTIAGTAYKAPFKSTTCGGTSANPSQYCSEWDTDNNGTPDNYFFASNSGVVETGLNTAFSKIVSDVSSGTAAAVANNKSGERGANMIQALFYPQYPNDRNIKWLGEVQALWYYLDPVISYSTIREDTDGDFELDLTRDNLPGSNPFNTNAIWKAGVNLHSRAAGTRNIYSLLSGSTDLTNSANAFSDTHVATLKPLLDVSGWTDPQATSLINFLRGVDSASFRSRTVTRGSTTAVWKLGDVINSTPKVQSSVPLNAYDQIYSDTSYKTFTVTDNYKGQNIVYGGANDGMLHAFKLGQVQKITDASRPFRIAGVVDSTDIGKEQWAYIPQNVLPYLKNTADQGYCHQYLVDGAPLVIDASIKRHTECTATNYWDCTRQSKVLTGTNDLDAGKTSWKTVLIGSMGLGGATRDGTCNETLSPDADLTNNTDCVKTSITGTGFSSYFALDVTDPLVPRHLWEFSDAVLPTADKGLGLTTPGPAVMRLNTQNAGAVVKNSNGRWFVVFASGPTGPIDVATRQFLGRSDQDLKIYVVDLNAFDTSTTFVNGTNYWVIPTGKKFAFANSISSASLDLDRSNSTKDGYYSDDVLYISYTKATLDSSLAPGPYPTAWDKGGILRLITNNDPNPANWFVSTLIDDIGPVTSSIGKLQDRNNKKLWIYFGEGRYFYTGDDLATTRRIFGIADPCYNYDTSHENTLSTTEANCPSLSVSNLKDQSTTPNEVLGVTDKGWYINLEPALGGVGAERVVTDVTASFNGIVFFTTFIPNNDICAAGGNSSLWAVKYSSGGTPPAGGLQGKAPLQTSSGSITMIDVGTAFTERGGRKLSSGLSPAGMPPKNPFQQLLQPKPVKQILNIQER